MGVGQERKRVIAQTCCKSQTARQMRLAGHFLSTRPVWRAVCIFLITPILASKANKTPIIAAKAAIQWSV